MSRAHRWIVANMVAGLDGSAAVDGRVAGLSNDADRALFQQWQGRADVVLVGAGTVRAERYEAGHADRCAGGGAWRRAAIRGRRSRSSPGRCGWTGPLPVLPSRRAPPARAHVPGRLPWRGRADAEHARRRDRRGRGGRSADRARRARPPRASPGADRGRSALLGELISLGLLDELRLTLAPVVGGDPLPIASGLGGRRT